MLNQQWIEMFRVIPIEQHNQVVVVLQNGSEIAIDTFFRFEPNFLVARGRVAGTTDENRAFFVPYNQLLYYRVERIVMLEELQAIFDGQPEQPPIVPEGDGILTPVVPIAAAPVPPMPSDPTTTRNALLERIRAARASQTITNRQSSEHQ